VFQSYEGNGDGSEKLKNVDLSYARRDRKRRILCRTGGMPEVPCLVHRTTFAITFWNALSEEWCEEKSIFIQYATEDGVLSR
jgi:hypothetical protein